MDDINENESTGPTLDTSFKKKYLPNENQTNGNELDDSEGSDAEDVSTMEKLVFDFEAYPPCKEDLEGLVDLITQLFLRTDIDVEGLAKRIIEQSPFGCVFKPAEEYEDDEIQSLVYGALAIVDMSGKEPYKTTISDHILQRANKFASKQFDKRLKELLKGNTEVIDSERIGLIINERMLHFPEQIAGPAFQSLTHDYKKSFSSKGPEKLYSLFLMLLKIRVNDAHISGCSTTDPQVKSTSKKTKADKKNDLASRMASAETLFDNAEEALLFKMDTVPQFFDYPVESDVERTSKFHCTRRNGILYRPFRRVCLLTPEQFFAFSDKVTSEFT